MTPFGPIPAFPPERRKIFISYHHDLDQVYYAMISGIFSNQFEAIQDNSLDRLIDSDDPDYVMRRIRENYIRGSSCTLVLCGSQTRWRKYVDWEIKATLDRRHGLVGVHLPTNPPEGGGIHKPDRLQDNLDSGYAEWVIWENVVRGGVGLLRMTIETANAKSKNLIDNRRAMRARNGQ